MSTYSPRLSARKPQLRSTWRIRLCALYCVSTAMRRRPELTQLPSAKSTMRIVPAKGTAGLARWSVSCCKRVPRPPASTSTKVWLARVPRLLWLMVEASLAPGARRGVQPEIDTQRVGPRIALAQGLPALVHPGTPQRRLWPLPCARGGGDYCCGCCCWPWPCLSLSSMAPIC